MVVIVFSFFDFKNGKLVGHIVRCWARSIFVASRIKTKITGLENLDISKNYIFAANHASSLDIPLMLGYLPFWTVPIRKLNLNGFLF
jgi:1-acyl-sn-glycerol-3-phosphate acyltransferase